MLSPRMQVPRWTLLVFMMWMTWMSGVVSPIEARGQAFGRIAETETNVAYFFFARPGEATVQVSLWGVPQSGIYEVPDGTDLDKLLTMAGGAPIGPRQENQKRPKVTIRLYRPDASRTDPILEVPLEEMLSGTATYPALEDDDIIVLEVIQPAEGFGWRDGLSLVTTAASVTLLTLRIIRFSN